MAADFQTRATIKGRDKTTAPFKRVAAAVRGKLRSSFRDAGRSAKRLARNIGSAVTKTAALGAAAGAAAAFGVWKLVAGTAKAGDDLAKFSRRAGVSAQAYAEIQHAAELAGVESAEFDQAIVKMTRNLGELKAGKGALFSLLKKVSPAFLEQLAAVDDNEKALNLLLSAMGKLEDPSKRAALAAAAFGRAGQRMTLMLEGGEEGLRKQRQEFRELAGVMDGDALKSSEEFVDAQTRVGLAIKGVKFSIARELFPVLAPMLTNLARWIAANRQLIGQKVSAMIADMARWIRDTDWQAVWKTIKDIGGGLKSAFEAIGGIKGIAIALVTIFGVKLVAGIGKSVLGMWKLVAASRAAAAAQGGMGVGGAAAGAGRGAAAAAAARGAAARGAATAAGGAATAGGGAAAAGAGPLGMIAAAGYVTAEQKTQEILDLQSKRLKIERSIASVRMGRELQRKGVIKGPVTADRPIEEVQAEWQREVAAVQARRAVEIQTATQMLSASEELERGAAQLAAARQAVLGEKPGKRAPMERVDVGLARALIADIQGPQALAGIEAAIKSRPPVDATVNLGVRVNVDAATGAATMTAEQPKAKAGTAADTFKAKLGQSTVRVGAPS